MRRTNRRPSLAATLAVLAVVAAGCESTARLEANGVSVDDVPLDAVAVDADTEAQSGSDGGTQDSPDTPDDAGDAVTEPSDGAATNAPSAGPTSTASPSGSSSEGPGTSSPSSPTAPPPPPPSSGGPARPAAPGVTDEAVLIGLSFTNSAQREAFNEGLGLDGLAVGDTVAYAESIAEWINERGGAGGKEIRFVLFERNLANDFATESQRACSTWTEDNEVFAGIIGLQVPDENLVSCLDQAGSSAIGLSFDVGHQAFFDRYRRSYVAPAGFESVRAARAMIDGLHAHGYFEPDSRVGVVYYDTPSFKAALTDGITPALAEKGLEVAETFEISYASGTSDTGRIAGDSQAAVLRFNSQDIDRVLFLGSGGALPGFFATNASQQNYYPRYGIWTPDNPAFVASNFGGRAMEGAVALGWGPVADVGGDALEDDNPGRTLCEEILTDAGFEPQSDVDRGSMYQLCSALFLVADGLTAAPDFSRAGYAEGVASLGRTHRTAALGNVDRWSATKRWGASAYRIAAYENGCRCFEYVTPLTSI